MNAEHAKEDPTRPTEGLVLGVIFALSFLGVSFLRIVGDAGSAMVDGHVRIAPLEQSIWGMRLAWRLAGFAGSLVVVHVSLGVAAWGMACLSRRAWPASGNSQRHWTCLWLIVAIIWILAANAAWFPSSSLGNPYAEVVRASIAGISVFRALSLVVVVAAGITVVRFFWGWRPLLRPPRTIVVPAAVVLVSAFAASLRPEPMIWTASTDSATQPNVIIVGLDSVRAGVDLPTDGGSAPALESFLREATVLSDTTTPLARTFAAWISILTGRHPHRTGATVNLLPRALLRTDETLADLFRSAGYEAIYATDEVRFSNIDESYGFDRIVGPRIGSADFLIEFVGDTPLSNLVVNTRLGDKLFPELHGNRAAKVLYNPDTFIHDLDRGLFFDSPTFLAVHFTLPHWPYTWAESEPQPRGTVDPTRYPQQYTAAVERVDRQFADLMSMLERKGALDDAIVVVLSDHGESVGENSPLSDEGGHMAKLLGKVSVYGHGTHVFSKDQYQVLLAFRNFGRTPLVLSAGERIQVPATLEDIAPTLADALELEAREGFDGRSLVPYLAGDEPGGPTQAAPRIRFLETEFNPPGIAMEEPMTASAVESASTSYRIDPATDHVEVRPEQLSRILASRQYAAVLDDHWLAAVPALDLDTQHLVYVGPDSRGPVWLDAPPGDESPQIQRQLWKALRKRFEPVAIRQVAAMAAGQQ